MNPLKRLIALRDCPRNLIAEARRFLRNAAGNPVSDGSLGSIRVEDITHALCLYRQGSLSEMELQEWADILEMCDYIDYEQGSESTIADLLFRLSSPDINEPIDRLFAEKLLKTVERVSKPGFELLASELRSMLIKEADQPWDEQGRLTCRMISI